MTQMFDVGGSSIFAIKKFKNNEYALALFNSKFASYVIDCLNPTVNKQVGDVERIPFLIPNIGTEKTITELSRRNIELCHYIDSKSVIEGSFTNSPLHTSEATDN